MNDIEFFNLCGQLVKYIGNKSEKKEKYADIIRPFINSSNSIILKEKILKYFEDNSFRLFLNWKILVEAMNKIHSFNDEIKFTDENKSKFVYGFVTSKNIFYQKDDKENTDIINIIDNSEFFNLCGQFVRYTENKSESNKIYTNVILPFVSSSNSIILKEKILKLYVKNSFKLPLNWKTLNEVIEKISSFDKKIKFDDSSFILGLTTNENIFYQKNNKESEKIEEQ